MREPQVERINPRDEYTRQEVIELTGVSEDRLARARARGEFPIPHTRPKQGARQFWYGWQVEEVARQEAQRRKEKREKAERKAAAAAAAYVEKPGPVIEDETPTDGVAWDDKEGVEVMEGRCQRRGCHKKRMEGDPTGLGFCLEHARLAGKILGVKVP